MSAMRAAIVSLIDHPEQARTQARQGYESVARRYNFERHIETLAQAAAHLALDQGGAGQEAEPQPDFIPVILGEFDSLGL